MAKDFIKTWDGKRLEDWGSSVSKEYKSFQQAMRREVKRLAEDAGATLVSYNSGHYDQSGFVERDGMYVYFSYSNLDRCRVQLTGGFAFFMRTASGPKDYHGGTNNNVNFSQFSETMEKLFREQAHKRLMDNAGVYVLEHTSAKGYQFVMTLFDMGVHVRVTAQDGTLLYHNEMWPGTWSETYNIYELSRRSMMDEGNLVYLRLDRKMQKQLSKAA